MGLRTAFSCLAGHGFAHSLLRHRGGVDCSPAPWGHGLAYSVLRHGGGHGFAHSPERPFIRRPGSWKMRRSQGSRTGVTPTTVSLLRVLGSVDLREYAAIP